MAQWCRVLDLYGPPPFGTPCGTDANPSSLDNWGHVDTARWLIFHQIGNRRTHDCYQHLARIFGADPPAPALNGEPYYDCMEDATPGSELAALYCCSAMYGSFLSGGFAGHIHGAGGWTVGERGLWSGEVEPEIAPALSGRPCSGPRAGRCSTCAPSRCRRGRAAATWSPPPVWSRPAAAAPPTVLPVGPTAGARAAPSRHDRALKLALAGGR